MKIFRNEARSRHGLIQTFWLAGCFLFTKVFFRPAKLVRLPIFLRGKSNIIFGAGFVSGYMVRLDAFGPFGCIEFGHGVQINDFVHIGALTKVRIGNDVLIASRVFISDHNHGIYGTDPQTASSPMETPSSRFPPVRPVEIGDRAWIGENVCILSGVTIGSGSVIGAGSVVSSDIPANCIAVGVPARVIRRFDFEKQIWARIANAAEPPSTHQASHHKIAAAEIKK